MAAYVAGVMELPSWIESNGGGLEELPLRQPPFPLRKLGTAFTNLPHSDAIGERVKVSGDVSHGGTTLWRFLLDNVERRGIEVRFGRPARRLLRDESGEITGVEAGPDGDPVVIGARRAVILTTGGFAYAPDMLGEHVGVRLPALGPPGRNTGDGIRMAQRVGADVWHMNAIAAGFGYQVPDVEPAWMCKMPTFGFCMVDRRGERFLNEPTVEHHAAGHALAVRDFHTGEFQRLPSYLVFDETTRQAGPIATDEAGANRALTWSSDNSEEIRKGWITAAESVDALAAQAGLPAKALVETLTAFNDAAVGGGIDVFGRPAEQMEPLIEPPFYAIPVMPSLFNTQGGPRRDGLGRVIDFEGQPIPRLFSAGELGSIWAALYPGAGNVSEAVVFGRIAGRNAAGLAGRPRRAADATTPDFGVPSP
jgi:succinate dehydrogenase/fumarate reductase flavoprotein subunit